MTDTPFDLSALVGSTPGLTPEARERLAANLQTLIDSEQVGHVESRRSWQRASWTHRAVVVAVAAAIVVVFFVPLPHTSLFHSLVTPSSTTTKPPTKLPVVDVSATPAGWVPVAYGDTQISVPPDFPVVYPGQSFPCEGASASGPGGLLVGAAPGFGIYCVVERHPTIVYLVTVHNPSSVDFVPVQKKPIVVNGVLVYGVVPTASNVGYYAPSLGVELTARGPLARRIVNTLTRSPRTVALAPGPAPAVLPSWQTLSFQSLTFAAPAKWPVEYTLSDYPFGWICGGGTLNHLTFPVVNLSSDKSLATRCWEEQSQQSTPQTPQYGLQIDSGPRTLSLDPVKPSFSKHCLSIHGLTACPATSPAYSILVLKVTVPGRSKPVYVSIGLAGNGMVARTILCSLRAVSLSEALGSLSGTFVAIGGLSGTPRPLPGKVTAKNSAGHRFTVTVGKSGKFEFALPAGLYRLTGRSPKVIGNGVEATCGVFAQPVRVRAGKETRGVQVVCPLK